jgi:hypothetical protein
MKSILFAISSFLVMTLSASVSMATGTAGRTFVSGNGNDSNACSLAAPCRTFAAAIAQTASEGEVVVLDSAGYGPFTINQAVTITAPQGVYAGITVTSASEDGIDVTAGSGDVVTLKGLTIIGPGANVSGARGIFFNIGGVLHVEGCEVRGFDTDIVLAASGQAFVKNTIVKDAIVGLAVSGDATGNSFASLDNVSANNNSGNGILEAVTVGNNIRASIRDSTISGNLTGIGVILMSGNTAIASIDVERCLIANGGTGIATDLTFGTGAVSLSNCLVSHNTTAGFDVSGGVISSAGNNTFSGNGPNTGTLTPLAAQ